MNKKDKESLSYLYELEQFKSLTKLCNSVRKGIAEKMLHFDLTVDNAERHIAFLQGQAFAIDSLLKKIKEINKQSQKN